MQPESTTVAPRRRRTRQEIAAEEAYAAFDASHRRGLVAYCKADLRNWADAEEVAADTLFTLWSHWPGLRARDDRTLRAYAFTTARRRLLHVAPRQRRQRQQAVPFGWGTDDMDGDPASSILPAATTARQRWTSAWRVCSMSRSASWSPTSEPRCFAAMAIGTRWPRLPTSSAPPRQRPTRWSAVRCASYANACSACRPPERSGRRGQHCPRLLFGQALIVSTANCTHERGRTFDPVAPGVITSMSSTHNHHFGQPHRQPPFKTQEKENTCFLRLGLYDSSTGSVWRAAVRRWSA